MRGPRCRFPGRFPRFGAAPGETGGRIGNVRLAADRNRLGKPGVRLDVSQGRWPVAGAEDLMLPVQRVEMDTGDLDVSATIGHLYARHRPRVRRLARARVDGGLRAAAAGPLNAGLVRMVGLEYQAQADPVDWLLTAAVSAGTVGATAGREQAIVARGGALLFPLGAQFTVTGRSAAAVALRIPLGAAADLAEESTGLPAADLRFDLMGHTTMTIP